MPNGGHEAMATSTDDAAVRPIARRDCERRDDDGGD